VINAENLSPPADEGPPVVDIDDNEASHIPVVVDEINPEVNSNVLNEEVEPVDDNNAEPVIKEEADDDPGARALSERHLEEVDPNLRRSARIKRPNNDPNFHYVAIANFVGVKKATMLYGDKAVKSIQDEIDQHLEKGTWKPLTPDEVPKIIADNVDHNVTKINRHV
jgi:hypothetical protein